MTAITTFYLSRLIGKKVSDINGNYVGIVKDLLAESDSSNYSAGHPVVHGIKLKSKNTTGFYSFQDFTIEKLNGNVKVICHQLNELPVDHINNDLYLVDSVLDKQIIDINGRKLVRVNDVRLVSIVNGTYAVAVDIGIEGLLRRIGIVKPLKFSASLFKANIPSKFILWEDVETIDSSNSNIKLSKSYKKLQTLHPSDLADIIEDLGRKASAEVFSSLDEEQAADVLEELEIETQIHIIKSLPIEKAADLLDKMPADEVADIFDALGDEKVELLLNEMEKDTSQEVRELLDYPDHTVGSIMSTEVMSFNKNTTVEEVFAELRAQQPEAESLYNLFVTDENEVLIATFSLRDLVVSRPETKIYQIMKPSPVRLRDFQEIDEIAEFISKYNMLAIPVVDQKEVLQGMVVIDDVIDDLMDKGRMNK
ncbi:MAG TPA: magnesium transporter MgtE [Prolixibacteraceae bacterium]|jgi:sporulation protein YlmC with PRC-barrel domain/flagellar motility protein MotE (MotC chaperone)|nr:magnesium transporter MgtE [Prolixibacteraceae bacterium]